MNLWPTLEPRRDSSVKSDLSEAANDTTCDPHGTPSKTNSQVVLRIANLGTNGETKGDSALCETRGDETKGDRAHVRCERGRGERGQSTSLAGATKGEKNGDRAQSPVASTLHGDRPQVHGGRAQIQLISIGVASGGTSVDRARRQTPAKLLTGGEDTTGESTLRSTTTRPNIHQRWIVSSPLLLIASIASCVMLGVWEPSLTFQPSVVGMMWAGTFLAGYLLGSLGRGQFWSAVVVLPVTWTTQWAFDVLTDMGRADSLLLTSILLLSGWVVTILDRNSIPNSDAAMIRPQQSTRYVRIWRWSIWEIGFVTAIVACVTHAYPRLESSAPLILAVSAALLAGLIFSWLACRWAWKDDWSMLSLLGLTLALATGLAVLILGAPAGLSFTHWVSWLVSGPVNVVAAQGVCVLATLGIWRHSQPKLPRLTAV